MHLIKLSDVNKNTTLLTQSVLQVSQMLGLYHAELARILNIQCADVGELANGYCKLEVGSDSWVQAEKFVLLFENLFLKFQGDEALMCNWLRRRNTVLNGVPLYLIVDDGLIDSCLDCLITDDFNYE